MKHTEAGHLPRLILLLPILLLAMLGCERHGGGKAVQTEGYICAKKYLKTYDDSLYANPEGLRPKLCSLQRVIPDSDGWYMLELYKGFADFIRTGDDKTFLSANDSVLDYCKRTPSAVNLKSSCLNVRSLTQIGSNTEYALRCQKEAYDCLEQAEDKTDQVLLLINMSDIYRMTNRYAKSSECLHNALEKSDSIGYQGMLVGIYMALAHLYSSMDQFALADKYFNRADTLLTKNERDAGQDSYPCLKDRFLLESNRGNSFYAQAKYEHALRHFLKAKRAADLLDNDFYNLSLYINLSEIYALTNHLDSAKHYLERADNVAVFGMNIDADFYRNTVAADIALREDNLSEAQRILNLPYDKYNVNKQYLAIRYKKLCEFYAKKGDYRKAYEFEYKADRYNDSIRNLQIQTNLAEINMRYQRDTTLIHRDLLIAKHEARSAYTNFFVVLILMLLFIVVAVAAHQHAKWRRKNEKLRSEAQSRILQLRMNAIYNRTSPHLVFNTVNNAKDQYPEPVFEKLTDVLRNSLLLCDRIAISISEELTIVKDYVELYRLTHSTAPEVVFDIPEGIIQELSIPAMCIQIPVENALKHAFVGMEEGQRIDISIRQHSPLAGKQGSLVITITDNGRGYDTSTSGFTPFSSPQTPQSPKGEGMEGANSTGNGLRLLYEEYMIMNQLNEEHITFNITSNVGKGTKTEIVIPNNYEYIHNSDSR